MTVDPIEPQTIPEEDDDTKPKKPVKPPGSNSETNDTEGD